MAAAMSSSTQQSGMNAAGFACICMQRATAWGEDPMNSGKVRSSWGSQEPASDASGP